MEEHEGGQLLSEMMVSDAFVLAGWRTWRIHVFSRRGGEGSERRAVAGSAGWFGSKRMTHNVDSAAPRHPGHGFGGRSKQIYFAVCRLGLLCRTAACPRSVRGLCSEGTAIAASSRPSGEGIAQGREEAPCPGDCVSVRCWA